MKFEHRGQIANLRLLHDWTCIRPDKAPEKSKGGIYFAGRAAEKALQPIGEVVAVGPGRYGYETAQRKPIFFKVGDRVTWFASEFAERTVGGEVLLFGRAYFVETIVEEGPEPTHSTWPAPPPAATDEAPVTEAAP